jgi:hypothetical protein
MSNDWSMRPEDAAASLAATVIFFVLLATIILGGNRQRESAIRLASPAFVLLDADSAQQVASDLGATFREYVGVQRRRGR